MNPPPRSSELTRDNLLVDVVRPNLQLLATGTPIKPSIPRKGNLLQPQDRSMDSLLFNKQELFLRRLTDLLIKRKLKIYSTTLLAN